MPLDESYYENFIRIFEGKIELIFRDTMINILKERNFSYRGFFRLVYKYLPFNYDIIIENEFRTFDISIEDSEGASNVLNRIKRYNSSLDEKDIVEALLLLKEVLEKNNLNFYFSVGNKIYRKNAEGIKRIRDIEELRNG